MKTPSIAPEATVLGVDSSTQSTKALVVCATTGRVLAEGRAPHPPGTEVDPRAWLAAADAAVMEAVAALPPGTPPPEAAAVGGQQHGMVLLDAEGRVCRDALLWNDTRSAPQARDLTRELGGPSAAVDRMGSVPVASFTAAKLRWVAQHEPEVMDRARTVLLPHDLVTRHLAGDPALLVTDRGDASGAASPPANIGVSPCAGDDRRTGRALSCC